LFADPDEGDYHLTWENFPDDDDTKSPCIDTGHPDLDEDPDGTRADMGVYYFHQAYPDIRVEPLQINFGAVNVWEHLDRPITISNGGEARLNGELSLIPEEAPFTIRRQNMEFTVMPDDEIIIVITFEPEERENYEAEMRIVSNDPDENEADIRVSLQGRGANQLPVVENPIDDLVIDEDSDWIFVADLNEVFSDPEDDELRYFANEHPHINFQLRESSILYLQPDPDFWENEVELSVDCDDDHGGFVLNRFLLSINSLNDLPEPFDLQLPENESVLNFQFQTFTWQEAVQNQWETDTVSYILHFVSQDFETEFSISEIRYPEYRNLPVQEIVDRLDLVLGCVRIDIDWWVHAVDDGGITESRERWTFGLIGGGVEDRDNQYPTNFTLYQNFPNPFNSETNIRFCLPNPGWVKMNVYDSRGRFVAQLLDNACNIGFYDVNWNANGLKAGEYWIEIRCGTDCNIRKAILLK